MPDITWTSPHTGSSEAARQIEVLWLTDSVFVVVWVNSASTAFEADVYNDSGTHLHSQTLFSVSPKTIHSNPIQLAKVRDNMFVLAYQDDGGFDVVRMYSLTWNGSSITNNGQIAALSAQEFSRASVCNEGDDKIMLWGRRFGATNVLSSVYCAYNGSTWTVNSATSISGSYYGDTLRACKAATDKGILFWDKDPGDDGKCHAFGTISGGGTNIVFIDGTREILYLNACNMGENKIIFVCYSPDSPASGRIYAIKTDDEIFPYKPIVGLAYVIGEGSILNTDCSKIDDTHFVVVFQDGPDGSAGKSVLCTVNWDTLTVTANDPDTFSENYVGAGSSYGIGMDSNSEGLLALGYRDATDSDYLKVIVGSQIVTPSPPTEISVEGGEGENIITFTVDPEADQTNAYWANSPGVSPETGNKISSVSSPYIHEDLNASLIYYYVLTSENEAGESDASAEYNDSPYPAIPENLAVDADIEKNTITWDESLGADLYNIYWSTSPGVDKLDNKITGATSPHNHESLTPGIPIYYVVAAEDEDGESSVSSEESGIPELDEPENLDVDLETQTSTILTWNSVLGATKYNIYYAKSPGVTKETGTKITDAISPYEHTDLDDGDTYYYVVTAENVSDESEESNEVSEYVLPIPVTPDPTISPMDSENVISWEDALNANTYNIYWSLTPGVTIENGTKIENVTSPYYHQDLTDQYYYYIMTSVNDYYESVASDEQSAKPLYTGKIYDHYERAVLSLIHQYNKE